MDFLINKDTEDDKLKYNDSNEKDKDKEKKDKDQENNLFEITTPKSLRRNRIGSLDEMEAQIPMLVKNISSANENNKSFILGVHQLCKL